MPLCNESLHDLKQATVRTIITKATVIVIVRVRVISIPVPVRKTAIVNPPEVSDTVLLGVIVKLLAVVVVVVVVGWV